MERWKVVFLICACLGPVAVFPQIKSIGVPAIVNYTSRDNHNITQTWSISQDKYGVMHFANNNGYLRFDSRNWKQFYLPHRVVSRAIYGDLGGRVYVGGFNDFGYFDSGSGSAQEFHSVKNALTDNEKHFEFLLTHF